MGVYGGIVRQAEIDDVRQVVYIKAACGDICSHEDGDVALAEFLHDDVALLLREVAVQRVGVVSVRNKAVGNILCFRTRTAEYYSVNVRTVVGDAF